MRRLFAQCAVAIGLAFVGESVAAPADQLLPDNVVGYVAVADVPEFLDRWSSTQPGRLAEEPSMRPFLEQIEGRFNREFGGIEERLGVTLDDLRQAASGEAALALAATNADEPGKLVALVESVGRDDAVDRVLAKVDERLRERGADANETADGVRVYRLAADPKADRQARDVAVFFAGDRLCLAESEPLATEVLTRISGRKVGKTLAERRRYRETQQRSRAAAGRDAAHVAWFLSPFEYDRATQDLIGANALPEKKSTMQILSEQGFEAITGIGGVVTVAASAERDFVHHSFAYAPPKPGAEGAPAAEKYDLAMRMLELPNAARPLSADRPPVERWAPRQIATYKTIYIDLRNAFDHLDTLFDAFAGYSDAFEGMLTAFERDPRGPRIRIKEEIVEHLGERVVVMTDYTLPITPECERYLIAIDVTDQEALVEPIGKWMTNDGAELKELDGVPYWELQPEDEPRVVSKPRKRGRSGLLPAKPEAGGERLTEAGERVLRRAAVCLHDDRLVIGSDSEFLRQALFGVSPGESLATSPDLQAAIEALAGVAPGERCAWNFTRSDESLRPTYELLREGRMPEAETFFGQLLNRLLTTDEEREVEAPREQRINGESLPSFELARRYFGPSARSVRSEADGWLISGVVLSKAPATKVASNRR